MIGKVIAHMRSCGARGTLLVPLWRSTWFWILLCEDRVHWNSFVHDWVTLSDFSNVFNKGRANNSLLGPNPNHSPVIALFIDFGIPSRVANINEYCTISTLGCSVCHSFSWSGFMGKLSLFIFDLGKPYASVLIMLAQFWLICLMQFRPCRPWESFRPHRPWDICRPCRSRCSSSPVGVDIGPVGRDVIVAPVDMLCMYVYFLQSIVYGLRVVN